MSAVVLLISTLRRLQQLMHWICVILFLVVTVSGFHWYFFSPKDSISLHHYWKNLNRTKVALLLWYVLQNCQGLNVGYGTKLSANICVTSSFETKIWIRIKIIRKTVCHTLRILNTDLSNISSFCLKICVKDGLTFNVTFNKTPDIFSWNHEWNLCLRCHLILINKNCLLIWWHHIFRTWI